MLVKNWRSRKVSATRAAGRAKVPECGGQTERVDEKIYLFEKRGHILMI